VHPSSLFTSVNDNHEDEQQNQPQVIRMSGARICDELLHSLFLSSTSDSMTILEEEDLDALLEMCLLTITAYARETTPGATYIGSSSFDNNPTKNAKRAAEGILHKLLSTPIRYKKSKEKQRHDENDNTEMNYSDNDGDASNPKMRNEEDVAKQQRNRQKTLLYILNSTLDTYAKAADSTLGGGAKSSRDAALRAEYLLLEAIQRATAARDDVEEEEMKFITSEDEKDGNDEKDSFVSTLSMVPPDVVSFNTVITAWAKSGRTSSFNKTKKNQRSVKGGEETATAAAERAEAMLKLMQELSDNKNNGVVDKDNGAFVVHPSHYSYDAVICAWGRSHHPDASDRAMNILTDIIERYNNYYSSSSTSSHDSNSGDDVIQQAPPPPFPNLRTFTQVLQSLANLRSVDAPDKAESILENMEEYAR